MPVVPPVGAVVLSLAVVATGLTWPGVEEVAAWLSRYPALIVLLVITVTGETAVLAAVLVATHGDWSLTEVVAWCFVGTVVSDYAWFRLAGVAESRLLRRQLSGERAERTLARLRVLTGERPYLALLVVKFLYGSRFLMLVYLATRRITARQFLLYDSVGTAVWLAVLVPIGVLVAHGLVAVDAAGRLDLVALLVVGGVLIWKGGSAWRIARARRRSLLS